MPNELLPLDPRVRIGHVHLKVAQLERALAFYCGVLGFELMQRHGNEAAFVSAGGYHHHIGLNTWESAGGNPPPGRTGLYHFAILYPTRAKLAAALLTPPITTPPAQREGDDIGGWDITLDADAFGPQAPALQVPPSAPRAV